MATEQKDYLISERMVNLIFVISAAGMVLALLALLLVATARPQGRLVDVDNAQYRATREQAMQNLEHYGETDDGRVTIAVGRAMDLLLERGID